MALADLLRKPIVPIMLTATPWPPPGGMSLIFSQLVYVDYYGVGGHGGCGIKADRTQRNNEIIALVSRYIDPSSYFLMNIDRAVDSNDPQPRTIKQRGNKKSKPLSRRQSATMYRRDESITTRGSDNPGYLNSREDESRRSTNEQTNSNQVANSNRVPRCAICNIL